MNMSEPFHFTDSPLRGELRHQVAMSRHTSWRAGGVADRAYRPADLADLQTFLRGLPAAEAVYAVGLGSNLLVRDGGLRGTVLLLHGALKALRMTGADTLHIEAGVPGAKLARFAAAHNLSGAAFFAGIPGTLGGMLAMNAGCYGSETWQHVSGVQVLTRSGELREREPGDYEIGYRKVRIQDSGFSSKLGAAGGPESLKEFFVSASLHFASGDGEVARRQIKDLLNQRIASQPLDLANAGSVFRNPADDHAARLIERCGLKGKRIGGAQVSEKHANFIVNTGGATAADIENLIEQVREIVAAKTGIDLHPEVRIIGEHTQHE
jgi:UDP-N-acetylmuramate dehydrogenase